MPVGVKGFQKGPDWNGNKKGAPKRQFRRDDFTDDIFLKHKEDITLVAERLFAHAMADKPWAIKLVFEYFLTRPKNRDEFENDIHAKVIGTLSNMPNDKLVQIQSILLEQINAHGEA